MKLLWKCVLLGLCFLSIGSLLLCEASGVNNGTESGDGDLKKDSKSGVIGPPQERRRISKDILFKNVTTTVSRTNSTSSTISQHQKRSPPSSSNPGQVQILESGSALRNRGEARILKRGPPGAGSRFTDSVFTLRNSLKTKQKTRGGSGYDSGFSGVPVSSSSFETIPLIPISGNNIPPPLYSFGGNPAPASSGSPGGSSYGDSYRPGGGIVVASTTSLPEIIFPPEEIRPTQGPKPIIGPGPGTSIPIIGGGGGGGEILPPSPPIDEIFPPAPPPDEDEFDEDILGRRLKVSGGRPGNPGSSGGSGAPGAPGGGVGVRTRTRVIPSQKVTSTRVSSSDSSSPLLSARDRVRTAGLRRDRLRDKVKEFKTTVIEEVEPIEVDEILVDDPNVITDFVFSDIKCFKTRQNEYFGATIHLKSGFHLPYIRDRPLDQLTSEECRLEQVDGGRGSYHMSVTDLRGCGVEPCGEAMCLTMVFPRVPTLALADDEVTTIKCIPQKSTISDTKSISFAGDSTENRRSSSTVEGGVQEFVAEVGVFRQNPGSANGLFVKRVNSGGVVQLGEPLQLRSVVRGTDGWKHSKLTDVKVWRMHDNFAHKLDNLDPNQASEVITLVDARGCRNDEYLVIADDHPIRDPRNDMVHHFTFKAFLFRGQRVNEPLVVTARVHACQEYHDCVMECETGRRRVKRSPVEINNSSAIVHGFDSKMALRVVGLKDHPSSILDDEFPFDYSSLSATLKERNRTTVDNGYMTCGEKMFASGLGGGCVMLLICGLGLALYTYIQQGKIHDATRKNGPPPRQGPPPAYRYPPPSARAHTTTHYQKPLPPTPTTPSQNVPNSNNSIQQSQLPANTNSFNNNNNNNEKAMNADISQVAKLLQELAKNNNNSCDDHKSKSSSGKSPSSGKNDLNGHHNHKHSKQSEKANSEYACIDESNSSAPSSSSSSSEDLSKHSKKGKDGMYIVYCYNDKKNKVMLPMSAPSSSRLRRKHLKGKSKEAEDDEDDEDFIQEDGNDSETQCSQTEESDEYGEIGGRDNNVPLGIGNGPSVTPSSGNGQLAKNQVIRRTVREVKKKSKQNNHLAFASTRSSTGGIIRRRVSSVYREGYLSGIRGAVVAAVQGSKNSNFPMRFKRAPSLGNIPSSVVSSSSRDNNTGKQIKFVSVRERRSARKRRQSQKQHYSQDQYSSEGMLSEGTTVASDLDSAYSGSNCSKLTEDHLYELKRNGNNHNNGAGRYPDIRDFQKLQKNLLDVQRQLSRNGVAVAHQGQQKQEVKRTSSTPSNNNNNECNNGSSAVAIGLGSPPLCLGETKATHFVTRDDSTTKILIVPETHV